MTRPTVKTRRLAWSGAAGAIVLALLATVGISSQASAKVDPYGKDARFISVGKMNDRNCFTLNYKAEGHMVDGAGQTIPNSTWHKWDGVLSGCTSAKIDVFAWEPENDRAELTLTVYTGDRAMTTRTFYGDQNLCLMWDNGSFRENRSNSGGGGDGNCTAVS